MNIRVCILWDPYVVGYLVERIEHELLSIVVTDHYHRLKPMWTFSAGRFWVEQNLLRS